MDDHSPKPALGNLPELSVSDLSQRLKRTVEDAFALVRVRGEISGFKRHTSGHLYFSLKDAEAKLDAVCWKGTAARLGIKPEDGLEVVATGRLTTYPGRSQYQIVVERLELAGVGALMQLLEQRRRKLAAEGLFAAERKRALPFLPRVIGVVTSPQGAVIRDILHRLRDRFPRQVLVWPVAVQGEGAAEQVARAIAGFNALDPTGPPPRPDLLIVARGGGSIEDLWAFNEEVVVRAVATSAIPVISAVGHETDTTLIDHVADRRAPTPTAAAEMAVPVRRELLDRTDGLRLRLETCTRRSLAERGERVAAMARGLRHPRERLELFRQRLDDLGERLPRALLANVRARRDRLAGAAGGLRPQTLRREAMRELERLARASALLDRDLRRLLDQAGRDLAGPARLLDSLSYKGVLARGFAVVRVDGAVASSAAAVAPGAQVAIEFHDGERHAVVAGGRAKPVRGAPPSQGSLL